MATDLIVAGPFELKCKKQATGSAKQVTSDNVKEFLASNEFAAVSEKQGCYIFGLRASRGFMVWYVGKATKSMKQECLTDHKLKHYNQVLFDGDKGTPVLFFVAPDGKKKKVPKGEIDDMETFLIQSALFKNPNLSNVQKTKNLPYWSIKGVVRGGKGRPTDTEAKFKKMMGLDK